MCRNITLKLGNVSENRDAKSHQDFAQRREICTCLHVAKTDKVKPVNSQYLTLSFHVEGL